MENEMAQTYDYREYDRIWQRVAPELNPYPEERTAREGGEMCCMGGATQEMVRLLEECIDGEMADRCAYLSYARCAPAYARRRLQQMAESEGHHAHRLLTVYYLTCGKCYRPAIPACPPAMHEWCPLLRELYHRESCTALRYEQGAAAMEDVCLREIFSQLAEDERCHARQILQLLEKTTLA